MGLFAKIKHFIMASTANKIATALVAVVVLGGGIAGVVCLAGASDAKAIVIKAAVSTFTGHPSAGEETFGWKALSAMLKEKGAEISADVSFSELPIGDLGLGDMTLPNAGLELVAMVNPQKEVRAVLNAKAANMTLLSGDAYVNQSLLQVNVPKLFKSALTINYAHPDIEQQMKDSYAAEYVGLTDAQIEEIAEYLPKQTTPVAKEEILEKMAEIIASNYNAYLGDAEFKKAGKEELQNDEETLKCKVYLAEADGRQVGQFIDMTWFTVKEYFKELAPNYNITPEQVEKAFGNSGTLAYQIKSWLRGPVTVKFYVWEERIVKISADWTMERFVDAGTTTEPGNMVITFVKEGNPLENMYLDLHTPIHQDVTVTNVPQRIDFTYQTVTEYTEEEYAVSYSASYNSVPYYLALKYESLSGDFECKAEAGEESLFIFGVVNNLEKGQSISVEADRYKYKDGDYSEEEALNVSISVKGLETEVKPLSGTQQDVLVMTESDFDALENEITKNVTKLLFSMMGLFQ